MSEPARLGTRLLFRVEPLPLESPRGYLCRVAQAHGYNGPRWLAEVAGLSVAGLEREDHARHIAHVLRLEPEEWRDMCYRHVKRPERFEQRTFYGQTVGADQFNYRHPRICARCLCEQPVWWVVWDLALVAACPKHRCLLINQCPTCRKKLAWHRPAVHQCRCGTDFRTIATEAADADLVAMNSIIYGAAGFPTGAAAEFELANYHFPPELAQLALGSLLRLVRFIGLIGGENGLRRRQRPFPRTDPLAAIQAGLTTVAVLRDWPRPFRETLKSMLPEEVENAVALRFADVFGNFYRHLFGVLPRSEFGFLHDAFERFVVEDWKGLVRGQHRFFSAATRRNSLWIPAEEAERTAHIRSKRIEALVHLEQIEGVVLKATQGRCRSECWIKQESLNRWIATRDAEFGRYMSRRELTRALGLTDRTILKVASARLIRSVEGPERYFPRGTFFLREDVMQIEDAFEKCTVPEREYSKPGEVIALRHALKNYLGRDSGLPAVIQAVVGGHLVPVGYTKRFPGITGYLFLSKDLRKYRPVSGVKVPPEGFLNYREAASMLGVKHSVIRGLVAQGILAPPVGYRSGLSKLVPAEDIRRFAARYVATAVLAKRFNLNGSSFSRSLKESGTPLLAVPIPQEGRRALFLLKDVAAQVRIPPLRTITA